MYTYWKCSEHSVSTRPFSPDTSFPVVFIRLLSYFRKAEELIQQIVQSRSREILPLGGVGNGTSGVNSVGMQNNSSRLSDSMSSGLPPSIPTVSTPTFTQVLDQFFRNFEL